MMVDSEDKLVIEKHTPYLYYAYTAFEACCMREGHDPRLLEISKDLREINHRLQELRK